MLETGIYLGVSRRGQGMPECDASKEQCQRHSNECKRPLGGTKLAGSNPDGSADLADTVEQSTTRISDLVKAVKDYSYMDRAPLQEIEVHKGLENTLTILHHKLKHGITVSHNYDLELPHICAYGSELNQVWINLIDNAIDAMKGQGELTIRTKRDSDRALVEIADNGPGVLPEIRSRIFEPFFSTKGVGEGMGLGLDIARRIVVQQHRGDVRVISQPGDTCFRVCLPLKPSPS